jgi:hypothetical protein
MHSSLTHLHPPLLSHTYIHTSFLTQSRVDVLLAEHQDDLVGCFLLLCRDTKNVDVLYRITELVLALVDKLDVSLLMSKGVVRTLRDVCKADSAASKDTRETCAKLFLVLSQKSCELQMVQEGVAETLCSLLLSGIEQRAKQDVAETLALCSLNDSTWELFRMEEIEPIAKYCSKTASKVRIASALPPPLAHFGVAV